MFHKKPAPPKKGKAKPEPEPRKAKHHQEAHMQEDQEQQEQEREQQEQEDHAAAQHEPPQSTPPAVEHEPDLTLTAEYVPEKETLRVRAKTMLVVEGMRWNEGDVFDLPKGQALNLVGQGAAEQVP